MRKLFALALVAVSVATAIAVVMPGQMRNTITLTWDYDATNSTGDGVFKVYSSTNIAVPLSNWALLATVASTNRSVTFSNIVAQQFWVYATFSNWWGESLPSNVAGTPQIPGSVSNLRISQ